MEGQSGLSELSVISWVSAIQGCPLSEVHESCICVAVGTKIQMLHACAVAWSVHNKLVVNKAVLQA